MAAVRILSSLLCISSLAGVQAQIHTPPPTDTTSAYTDPLTGISFQKYANAANGFSFGIALPDESSTDFIGQISASTIGWAGVTLTGAMRNNVLVVAWPNGKDALGSLRYATSYSYPTPLDADATLEPIQSGISVNSTAFTYTFLCKGCLVQGKSFDPTADTGVLGWAFGTAAVTNPSSASASIGYHNGGYGSYTLNVTGSKSSDFASWAALAGGNSTTPPPGTEPPSNDTIPISNSTYDYIVVGAGAAGLIASERLAETGKSVLVIERGGPSYYSTGGTLLVPWNDTLTEFEVPGLFVFLASLPGNDGYCPDTPGMAGCILGGGTIVNGLQFVRPPSFDFDERWPEGWKWADVEPAASRFYERNPGTLNPSVDGKYYDTAVYDILSKLYDGAGWKYVDTNKEPDKKFQVYSHPALNVANGRRSGPVSTYLPLANRLSNFKLQLHTKVVRAVRTNSTITGVEVVDKDGQQEIINVNPGGKVILAAGAMSSPRILFNSGIGPADQINIVKSGSTGVKLPQESAWINLPVGHIRDHTSIFVPFNVNAGLASLPTSNLTDPSEETLALYNQGSGILAQAYNRFMTYTTVKAADGHEIHIQVHASTVADNSINFQFSITHGLTSTGLLGITAEGNTQWLKEPYLNTDVDKAALAAGVDEVLAISRKPNSTITYAGSANDTGADVVASAIAAGNLYAGAHFTSSTIMGTDDGRKGGNAVVDTDCKVYGTDNLFVVDASMHADIPTGNSMAIVMVAAEKAVEKILALDGLTVGKRVV